MSEYIVEMIDIEKYFPGVKALDYAQLHLKKGEVMALLGENGAGKSTLVKILSGVYTKDSGIMLIEEKEVEEITPTTAKEYGISIIHQELNMCTDLSVAENIFLGNELVKGIKLSHAKMNKRASEVLSELNIDLDPDEIVGNLPVSKQQIVEIAKAIAFETKILIMDEPTSALSDKEIKELFRIIHVLRDRGVAIVYISHRLAELKHIVDKVTILRDGQYISSASFADITLESIIKDMVGREISEQFPRDEVERGEVVFEVKDLNAGPMVRNINLQIREGEVLGLAGLIGAGRTETTRAIFGVDPRDSGNFYLKGEKIQLNNASQAIKQGVVLVPEDRRKDGLCLRLSVKDNLNLPNTDMVSNAIGIVNRKKEDALSNSMVEQLQIKVPHTEVDAATLSGGNQQKVVIGKWLARNSKVIIMDEPTRGIDVAAKVEIYNLINALKKEGLAILFVSSELPEILGVTDRIIVMCDGRITGELTREEANQEKIMTYATDFENKFSSESD